MYDVKNITTEEAEEEKEFLRENESDLLNDLLAAADYIEQETKTIEIVRGGKTAFKFRVHALSEQDLTDIRKKYTKYTKSKRNGVRVPEEVDSPKSRSSIIYNSTVKEDQQKIWDNRALWNGLEAKGKTIINALDVIDALLLPGEKDRVIEILDDLNGYNSEGAKEEVAKK